MIKEQILTLKGSLNADIKEVIITFKELCYVPHHILKQATWDEVRC
jgi:hypothetical protein